MSRESQSSGRGLMGHGIALTLARAGHAVTITDPDAEALASGAERVAESLKRYGRRARRKSPTALRQIDACRDRRPQCQERRFCL